jgi:sugar lactone lactonase YvrE
MAEFEVRRVLDIKAELGEAPLWSVEEQALFWVDIHKQTFNRFDPTHGENRAWRLPATPGCFAFRGGRSALIATDAGYYDFACESGALELVLSAPFDAAGARFNDGKTDRQGRFWAGTISVPRVIKGANHFFRFENGVAVKALDGVSVANGLAFSPDGRIMYRAESMERTIYALDYDPETGAVSN